MTEIRRYTQKPVTIEAVQLWGYGDFTRAVKWINDNGGSAVFAPATWADSDLQKDYLIIQTEVGNVEAYEGDFVVKRITDGFTAVDAETFNLCYDADPIEYAVESTAVGNVGRRVPKTETVLCPGAALQIPT